MTIAIAIRTASAGVFAADSKITTSGIIGYEEDGTPRWVEQTYDNAAKVVHDRSLNLMAMAAGYSNIGQVTATDFISTQTIPFIRGESVQEQDRRIEEFVKELVKRKRAYWETTQVDPETWPGPTVLLAAPSPDEMSPRVWRVALNGPGHELSEILKNPGIRMEGSYDEVFALMYGHDFSVLTGIFKELGIEDDRLNEALTKLKVLRPIEKLNLWSVPIQDAIDMAVFLATVQVEMDRFLPGTPACGGPIDVMVLHMSPEPGIRSFPGKTLRHPRGQG
jgi:hypothetical protein